MVTLKLTAAEIGKCSIMIGLQRLVEGSQLECSKMLRFHSPLRRGFLALLLSNQKIAKVPKSLCVGECYGLVLSKRLQEDVSYIVTLHIDIILAVFSSGATGWTGGTRPPPPISHRDQFSNSSKSDQKEGGGTVGFISVSRSNKYTCRVTKNCAFKFLYDLENSLHYYPENPGNCMSGIPDFKIFAGEHALEPPRLSPPPPNFNALAPPLAVFRKFYLTLVNI